MIGIIANIPADKDFGFIKVEGEEKNYYFHSTKVTDPAGFAGLTPGAKVSFDTEVDSQNRTNAINVKLAV